MIDGIKHRENENSKFRARSNIDPFPGLWLDIVRKKPKLVEMLANKAIFKCRLLSVAEANRTFKNMLYSVCLYYFLNSNIVVIW